MPWICENANKGVNVPIKMEMLSGQQTEEHFLFDSLMIPHSYMRLQATRLRGLRATIRRKKRC